MDSSRGYFDIVNESGKQPQNCKISSSLKDCKIKDRRLHMHVHPIKKSTFGACITSEHSKLYSKPTRSTPGNTWLFIVASIICLEYNVEKTNKIHFSEDKT